MREGLLNIGLSYYQERQWIEAIKQYGKGIMEKSLLSIAQKEILLKEMEKEGEK
jgi:hypothetical protein